MNDLLQQIEAAIAETERIALEADNRDSDWWWAPDAESAAERHIAHNDPARILRRVARDRKLLERHKPEHDARGRLVCSCCRKDHTMLGDWDNVAQPVLWPCDDVRDLAEGYEIQVES